MTLVRFDPPGFVDDLDAQGRNAWHDFISFNMDRAREGRPAQFEFDGPREQFVNGATTELVADAVEADIDWTGFPRNIEISSISDVQRWRRADASRDVQDEYCEWAVEREPGGKITSITFTCEGPEYWNFLASTVPEKVVDLYRQHVSENVKHSDIFNPDGEYNPRNRWNNSTEGSAMHLIQVNNTLGAEIELAGGASVRRVIDGRELTGEQELILCGGYGDPQRHSDPHIGAGANAFARQRALVTLANPVGIYFAGLNTQSWQTPDGTDPAGFWKIVRGTPAKPVRATLRVPAELGYAVGDITISGREIKFGGQVADHIKMKLTAVASGFGTANAAPMTACRKRRPQQPSFDAAVEAFSTGMARIGAFQGHR
ncbi:hypothetical protein GOC68_25640 [Sinorhizobium medicae]|nr:hypothetical protein [Sinorhizobium medicae]